MADTYQTWVSEALAPGFFRRKWGKRYMRTLGFMFDVVSDSAKYAVKARFPTMAPDDALGYIGDGRNIDKYRAESDASYRDAVVDARAHWEAAGTRSGPLGYSGTVGLTNEIKRLSPMYTNVFIAPWYQLVGTPSIGGASHAAIAALPQTAPYADWWSSFYVIISPNPFTKRHWGDAGLKWGQVVPSVIGNPDGVITWGSGANHHDVAELRRCIHKWKSAHEICPYVIFRAPGADFFDPANSYIGTRYYRP